MKNKTTLKLVTSAMLITLGTVISFICELIPFLNLPFGGTITVCSLLPIVIISWMYGLKWGFGSAFVYSVLQTVIGLKTVSALFIPDSDSYMGLEVAIVIILIDYIAAFTSVGISGVFRKLKSKTLALVLGSILGTVLCYLFHVLSGAVFYGAWAEWFFTDTIVKDWRISKAIMENFSGTSLAVVYSFIYNGCYMIPEIIITAVGAAAVSALPQIKKERESLKYDQ
ncbi:MAG: energy-coupled thiamine transporter ThiT [Clostridia bacterium]|nr:energy-coupled thiamine transporter ThiT [Clostridia bacterium]